MLTIDQRAAALYAQVTDRRVAEWYRKHGGLDEALEMAEKGGGYSFDPKSGLFVGGVLRGAAGKTAVKRIIFPRPVDHHVHRGGDERVTILRGSGTIHVGPYSPFTFTDNEYRFKLRPNVKSQRSYLVRKGVPHSWKGVMELQLEYPGSAAPQKETVLRTFANFWYWDYNPAPF